MTPSYSARDSAEVPLRGRLIALSVGLYLVMCAVVYMVIRSVNQGHFVFGLDDPYIHLALAQQIAHGIMGSMRSRLHRRRRVCCGRCCWLR